jgi:hypothetical protein
MVNNMCPCRLIVYSFLKFSLLKIYRLLAVMKINMTGYEKDTRENTLYALLNLKL